MDFSYESTTGLKSVIDDHRKVIFVAALVQVDNAGTLVYFIAPLMNIRE